MVPDVKSSGSRSLRAVTVQSGFGERTIRVDCDVLQADGGTRTASITGAWVALYQCFAHMQAEGLIEKLAGRGYTVQNSTALL